jgi:dihydroneopterin aldolase
VDTIFVEKLTLRGKHGVSEEERRAEQLFVIDIAVDTDTQPAAASDDIADTVNYSDFVAIAREVVEGNSFHLIEKIVEIIGARILQDARVVRVSVTIRKPSAIENGMAGVSIVRTRE